MDANDKQFETELRAIQLRGQTESEKMGQEIRKTKNSLVLPGTDNFLVASYPELFQSKDSLR